MEGKPTLPELLRLPVRGRNINVIKEIGAKYYELGIQLLQDKTGAKMEEIVDGNSWRGNSWRRDSTRAILSCWIKGEGKQPVTWATLVSELSGCGLTELAENIRSVIN